jgi:hypothetical protein
MQKAKFVKSIPLFFNISPPRSTIIKVLLREIIKENPEPLTFEEVKQLKQQRQGRKRVFLTSKDTDLINFFVYAPINLQYAIFKELNERLQREVKP